MQAPNERADQPERESGVGDEEFAWGDGTVRPPATSGRPERSGAPVRDAWNPRGVGVEQRDGRGPRPERGSFDAVPLVSTALAGAERITESIIWNPYASMTTPFTRGRALHTLAGHSSRLFNPLVRPAGAYAKYIDYSTARKVTQVKTVFTENLNSVRKATQKALRDAARFPGRAGRIAEARIILPTGASARVVNAVRESAARVVARLPHSAQVTITKGIPGLAGAALRGATIAGVGLSTWGLYDAITRDDWPAAVGSGLSLVGLGLAGIGIIVGSPAIVTASAVVGVVAIVYEAVRAIHGMASRSD